LVEHIDERPVEAAVADLQDEKAGGEEAIKEQQQGEREQGPEQGAAADDPQQAGEGGQQLP
jgi:hypothetical protein